MYIILYIYAVYICMSSDTPLLVCAEETLFLVEVCCVALSLAAIKLGWAKISTWLLPHFEEFHPKKRSTSITMKKTQSNATRICNVCIYMYIASARACTYVYMYLHVASVVVLLVVHASMQKTTKKRWSKRDACLCVCMCLNWARCVCMYVDVRACAFPHLVFRMGRTPFIFLTYSFLNKNQNTIIKKMMTRRAESSFFFLSFTRHARQYTQKPKRLLRYSANIHHYTPTCAFCNQQSKLLVLSFCNQQSKLLVASYWCLVCFLLCVWCCSEKRNCVGQCGLALGMNFYWDLVDSASSHMLVSRT